MKVIPVLFFFMTFILSALICPLIIKIASKFGWYDYVEARKMHTGKIPRLGGIAVVISCVISCIGALNFVNHVDLKFNIVLLIIGFTFIFVSCEVDDFINMRARYKLCFQCFAAICVVLSGVKFNNLFKWTLPIWLDKIGVFIWVILLVNAYNLIDGVDWLCSGLSVMALFFYSCVYYQVNLVQYLFIIILCGALLGFMVWNKPKAKIFLGDCGSQSIGYFLAVIPLIPTSNVVFEYNRILICLIISAIPTIDVLAAVWRRLRDKVPIFTADKKHIHHKLYNIGFSSWGILLVLFCVQFFCCLSCYVAVFVNSEHGLTLMCFTYLFVFFFFAVMHYVNRVVFQQKEQLNKDNEN